MTARPCRKPSSPDVWTSQLASANAVGVPVARLERERDLYRIAHDEHRMQQTVDQRAPEIKQGRNSWILDHERPVIRMLAQQAEEVSESIRCPRA